MKKFLLSALLLSTLPSIAQTEFPLSNDEPKEPIAVFADCEKARSARAA